MAKRLTDTEKWKDDWYLSLTNDYRTIGRLILITFTHAGILKKNLKMLNFCCNTNINEEGLSSLFNGRLIDRGEYYFIPKFLKFQYENLNSERPVIVSVRKALESRGLSSIINKSFGNDYLIIKSKSKDKSKSKEGVLGETFRQYKDRIESEYRSGGMTVEEKNKRLKAYGKT